MTGNLELEGELTVIKSNGVRWLVDDGIGIIIFFKEFLSPGMALHTYNLSSVGGQDGKIL